MEAGPELDRLVAERVMGWRGLERTDYHDGVHFEGVKPGTNSFESIPRYSTDIAAAWEVVEKLPPNISIKRAVYDNGTKWQVVWGSYSLDEWTQADTAPLAICLAALKAVGAG